MKKLLTVIRNLWRRVLEYLGILKVIIDIGNEEIHILEILHFTLMFKVISIKSEKIYDNTNFSFILERFLEKNTTHKVKRINLTLSSTSIIPLFLSFPDIPREKIESAILWEIERNIPLPIDEAYFSYKIVSRVMEDGKFIWNVLAVLAKKEEIDKYLNTFNKLNIIVEDISYLPINILSALNIENSENGIGYVNISEHSIELYIMQKKKIISFAHYIGDFKKINSVTIRNIMEYFADFIKRRIAFLERIIVITKPQCDAVKEDVIETLMDSLNILTMPVSDSDFLSVTIKNKGKDEIYDLLGFANKSFINLQIAPQLIKNIHTRDVISRVALVLVLFLNIISLSYYPAIIRGFNRHSVILKARNTPLEQITDQQVLEMAQTIRQIEELDSLQQKQHDLVRKIQEIEMSGIESSNLKIILSEISRLIPSEVWLRKVTINRRTGEIEGFSLTTDGLENFVIHLVNSKVVNNVVLNEAELVKSGRSTRIKFSISFGVSQ
jgi:hypothetical protein